MLYFANPVGSAAVAAHMQAGTLGFIDTPAQRNRRPAGVTWCADNGCYGKGWPGEDRWLAWLERNAADAATCWFATAPDVVGDYAATVARSRPMLEKIRALGYPAGLVAQDGMEHSTWDCWDEIDALFIGGSDAWKLGPAARDLVALAGSLGKTVHMGRVNSARRYAYAAAIGCDSVDGTFLRFGPDVNLPRLLSWTERHGTNPPLFN